MVKEKKYCSNCKSKYSISFNDEEVELEPLTCPFCGYEIEDEEIEEVEQIEEEDNEDDSWN
jgi:hypothetical protein|tara:strand:- start:396 stop:578 length:183 start_codon:yes stop_codon:yes gene_type:complete